jgi:hypothetical protein
MLNIIKFRLCLNELRPILSEFAVLRQNTYIHPGLAAGKMDLPGPNISSNPDENIAGFGRGQPKRVEML